MSFTFDMVITALMTVITLLLALLPHEIAHGYTAYLMGDRTAKHLGRLSMNPFRHINPVYAVWILLGVFVGNLIPQLEFLSDILMFVGFILLLKPVPINPANFRDPKKGMAITALMGPVTNLVIAFVSLLLFCVIGIKIHLNVPYLQTFLAMLSSYNITLAVFNLIPVPPLDGSRVLFAFLPSHYYFKVMQYERYIMLIFLVLVYSGSFDLLLSNGVNNVIACYGDIIEFILGIG